MEAFINDIESEEIIGMSIEQAAMSICSREVDKSYILIKNGYTAHMHELIKDGDRVYVLNKEEKITEEEINTFLKARHSPKVHESMSKSVVGIAGLGGLGSNIAMNLARLGVGKMIICDFDIVEPTNLNRQNYYIEHLGRMKTSATEEIIHKINPYVEIEKREVYLDKENFPEVFKECSIVVEAFDKAECKAELVNWVLGDTDKYIVAASGMAGYYDSNSIKTRKIGERLFLIGDGVNEAKEFNGLMAPRVAIAAGHQANCVVRIIMGEM